MLLLSLAFSVTCLLTIIVCIARVSFLYGQIKSDDEWKVKYEKLYTTATAEILKAKGYSPIIPDHLSKSFDSKKSAPKIKPLEKLNKEKSDPILNNLGLRIVRTEDDSSKKED
jgi:hypothetical protein